MHHRLRTVAFIRSRLYMIQSQCITFPGPHDSMIAKSSQSCHFGGGVAMGHMMSGQLGQVLIHATIVKALAARSSMVPTYVHSHPNTHVQHYTHSMYTQHVRTSVQLHIRTCNIYSRYNTPSRRIICSSVTFCHSVNIDLLKQTRNT